MKQRWAVVVPVLMHTLNRSSLGCKNNPSVEPGLKIPVPSDLKHDSDRPMVDTDHEVYISSSRYTRKQMGRHPHDTPIKLILEVRDLFEPMPCGVYSTKVDAI